MQVNKKVISRRKMLLGSAALTIGTLGYLAADDPTLSPEISANMSAGMIPLIYSPGYNVTLFGLERLHPFDGRKFHKIQKHLLQAAVRNKSNFLAPKPITREQLKAIHTDQYLDSLSKSQNIARILELDPLTWVPASLIDWRILKPMRHAAGGTLLTCELALKSGIAINLGGGYHHADKSEGGGFCVYCDVPVAINLLRQQGLIKRAMIVDTDAHQGNGFSNATRGDLDTFVVDLFDESIYPYPKVSETFSVAFPANTGGETYLKTLREVLPAQIDQFKPDLIVHNAGSDVLASDPLSSFSLSVNNVNERDLFVTSLARERKIPIAMVLAGGYSTESAQAHAQSIVQIIRQFEPLV